MSKVDIVKSKLITLVEQINENGSGAKLEFKQQDVIQENMSICGANCRLYVFPTSTGYDVSLSGKSLEKNSYLAMQ